MRTRKQTLDLGCSCMLDHMQKDPRSRASNLGDGSCRISNSKCLSVSAFPRGCLYYFAHNENRRDMNAARSCRALSVRYFCKPVKTCVQNRRTQKRTDIYCKKFFQNRPTNCRKHFAAGLPDSPGPRLGGKSRHMYCSRTYNTKFPDCRVYPSRVTSRITRVT
jgi:hypothetical protein